MSNMYTGKSSRNPYKPLLYYGAIGLALLAFGIYNYMELSAWELSTDPNEEFKMHTLSWTLYDWGGKYAVLAFPLVIGLGSVVVGWYKTKELKSLKNEAKH